MPDVTAGDVFAIHADGAQRRFLALTDLGTDGQVRVAPLTDGDVEGNAGAVKLRHGDTEPPLPPRSFC